ncbi:MAG TPA: cell division protein SepF [Actinomycetes bacterium]|nr:cell division protein SepF [Actinomycetes bacterium]
MAGAMRKMAVYLGLVEEDDRFREYDEYEAFEDDGRAHRDESYEQTQRTRTLQPVRDDLSVRHAPDRPSPDAPGPATSPDYRITTLHPRAYNDARAIGEAFREGTPVIMNLTEMDDTDAKRIVDFAAGLVFGKRGTIERVTQKVFLLSPVNVVVTAEEKQRLVQGGFFNQS